MSTVRKSRVRNGRPAISKVTSAATGKFVKSNGTHSHSSNERYHVISRESKWIVRREGAEKAYGIYNTKNEAIQKAQKIIQPGKGYEIYIHGKDGKVLEKRTFGSYPA